ncbi:MAG: DUF3370 domain-containing protein [Acaryochloridaceae cyanobacterium SU_2_1]|nr:DUF3370 domain-containing protein [Acaryochloridaceae cyanobacterium SU_2_1]NJM95043.1 DUF3370 domain-containing protein [Acaryochloridaceae cyanobacterium CSU_5_19]
MFPLLLLSAPTLQLPVAPQSPLSSVQSESAVVVQDKRSDLPKSDSETSPPEKPSSPQSRHQSAHQEVEFRSLPGRLDTVPVFNSNSPEVIRDSGILLSTFPPQGKRHPQAHLNYAFTGRFDIFSHHIAKSDRPDSTPTPYQGILIYNPSRTRVVTINVLQAASYLGTPDAPFIALPQQVSNDLGRIYSGPGSRVVDHILRGRRQTHWPPLLTLQPGQSKMLMNLPIPLPRTPAAKGPVRGPETGQTNSLASAGGAILQNTASSSNTRSTLAHLYSTGPIYMANMSMLAPTKDNGTEDIPSKKDWETLLLNGKLLTPRDLPPSPVNQAATPYYYGRVAGVSRGSLWQAQVTDQPNSKYLTIPKPGNTIAYGLSSLQRGTFGTGQVQSAPMLVRYPDTAYLAHGNYGVRYNLTLPLYNPTSQVKKVVVAVQTPFKHDRPNAGLAFSVTPKPAVFFRGTIRVRYKDDDQTPQAQYFHIVQRQGEPASPLVTLMIQPGEQRLVNIDYIYPPDATPPQVLTVKSELYSTAPSNP